MSKIKSIYAREILDSRGNPTVEAEVELESGAKGAAAVPSGASTGSYEDLELRDKDANRFGGQGVLKAVSNVNTIIRDALLGMDAGEQKKIDKKMIKADGTDNKSNLGANAILGVSLAVARASSIEQNTPLYKYIAKIFKFPSKFKIPIPMFNVLNGGKHSDSGLSVQEFMIIPAGIKSFSDRLRSGSEIFHALARVLSSEGHSVSVGDEGGFAPKLESNSKALEIIIRAVEKAGYKAGSEINLGVDAAANSFFNKEEEKYLFKPENVSLSREMLINIYSEWIQKYNVISAEDGLNENDWDGWKLMEEKIGQKAVIIGDDLLVTKIDRLKKGIEEKACGGILIKVNQAGTLWETIETVKLAKKNNMKVIVSHRSGETTDDFIADLAVGIGADFIKSGSLCRGERICKYNRLLKIEEEVNKQPITKKQDVINT